MKISDWAAVQAQGADYGFPLVTSTPAYDRYVIEVNRYRAGGREYSGKPVVSGPMAKMGTYFGANLWIPDPAFQEPQYKFEESGGSKLEFDSVVPTSSFY